MMLCEYAPYNYYEGTEFSVGFQNYWVHVGGRIASNARYLAQ